ncbi:hypothetical protein IWZ01DRAFT_504871 [Phyllosticta capitalensis]
MLSSLIPSLTRLELVVRLVCSLKPLFCCWPFIAARSLARSLTSAGAIIDEHDDGMGMAMSVWGKRCRHLVGKTSPLARVVEAGGGDWMLITSPMTTSARHITAKI